MTKRVQWIDCIKGIAILMIIIGHTVRNPLVRGMIFLVHMPVFFLAGGYTTKPFENRTQLLQRTVKSVRLLIISAYAVYLHQLPLYIFILHRQYSVSHILITALFASGSEKQIGALEIPSFGMM